MNAVLWLFGRFLCLHRMTNAELDWNGNTAIIALIPKIVVSVLAIAATFLSSEIPIEILNNTVFWSFSERSVQRKEKLGGKCFTHYYCHFCHTRPRFAVIFPLSSFFYSPKWDNNIPSPAFQWEFPPLGNCLTFFSFPPSTLRPCPHYWSIYSCPHYRFDAFSIVHTKTFESDRIARCDVSWTLCACYKHTHLRWFRSSFWFGMF